MTEPRPTIAVLGASGLIGEAVAADLRANGFTVVAIARHFAPSQKARFGKAAIERPVVDLDQAALSGLFADHQVDIVVNCIGVLQDGNRGDTRTVHFAFAQRLLAALKSQPKSALLVQISIPGNDADDLTEFSRSKRQAEHLIAGSTFPHVILRPGFVVAPAAYGGSALIRALAVLPFDLPERESGQVFMTTDIADIAATIRAIADRWTEGERDFADVWDVMHPDWTTVGAVIGLFRNRYGGPGQSVRLPGWLLGLGTRAGDIAARLGWSPPIRSTALEEMRRGVEGNPQSWIEATGIKPHSLNTSLKALSSAVQEKWFARLYLAKALMIAVLVLFWCASGLIALTVAFDAAVAILTGRGFPLQLAEAVTIATSLTDIGIGVLIAFRRTCRAGLIAGIGLSLFYMAGAAMITPGLWIEPLGALVKTGPAIVLMLVALAILPDR